MEIHGKAYWPGAESVASATYTCSHGITQGVAVVTINPQKSPPAVAGTLIFDDNQTHIEIPDCKLDRINARQDGSGTVWDLVILDRRWRWRELGQISGVYNQVDPNGKTLQWTARTPKQLAELCLQAMGERRYQLILPNVTVLPPVQWDHVPPAQALQAFVESLGCRVIYRVDTNSILICPPGEGQLLPDGSVSSDGPTLDSPERPDRLVVYGQPVRFQARFKLEAVGEDWDGSIRPIEELSYKPALAAAARHSYTVTPATVSIGNVFVVTLEDEFNGQIHSFTATAGTVANVTAGLTALINAAAAAGMPWTATDNTTTLTISGPLNGTPFTIETSALQGAGSAGMTLKWVLATQGQAAGQGSWDYAPPPVFEGVQATDRLTKNQARALAQKSVFRYYRITAEASGTGERGPLRIPEYEGPIVRREQIVLHQTRAQPIEPQEQDEGHFDNQGRPRKILFYDGHTRDKPATCWGSYHHGYSGGDVNTTSDSEVARDFSIDSERQLVIFGQYTTFLAQGRILPAPIVLETGCNVRDATTNALVVIEAFQDLGPPFFGTPAQFIHREDVQMTVIGIYDAKNKLGASLVEGDYRAKLLYYLQAYAAQYRNVVSQDRVYNGLVPLFLDGAIQQVTWSIGERGAETHASRNTEHSKYIPPFPVRKKNEAMDPIIKGKLGANLPLQNGGSVFRLHQAPASQSSSSPGRSGL